MTWQARFWDLVNPGPGDCWEWQGSQQGNGYGVFSVPGPRSRLAHRIAYELAKGPIPEGLTIDHLCRNRACVRPAHLEAVTMRENILRGTSFSAQNARKTHCPKGHPYTPDNLAYDHKGGRMCRICARGIAAPGNRLNSIAYKALGITQKQWRALTPAERTAARDRFREAAR